MDCVVSRIKGSTTTPNKKIEDASISWAKRKNFIDGLDKGKRTNAVCSASMGERIIFGPDKSLKFADRPMAGLGASTTLDKKAKLNANCLSDKKRSSFFKPEKDFRGVWGPGGRGSVSVAELSKKKKGAGRPRASKRCLITELETTMVDIDNPGNSIMLLS